MAVSGAKIVGREGGFPPRKGWCFGVGSEDEIDPKTTGERGGFPLALQIKPSIRLAEPDLA